MCAFIDKSCARFSVNPLPAKHVARLFCARPRVCFNYPFDSMRHISSLLTRNHRRPVLPSSPSLSSRRSYFTSINHSLRSAFPTFRCDFSNPAVLVPVLHGFRASKCGILPPDSAQPPHHIIETRDLRWANFPHISDSFHQPVS